MKITTEPLTDAQRHAAWEFLWLVVDLDHRVDRRLAELGQTRLTRDVEYGTSPTARDRNKRAKRRAGPLVRIPGRTRGRPRKHARGCRTGVECTCGGKA